MTYRSLQIPAGMEVKQGNLKRRFYTIYKWFMKLKVSNTVIVSSVRSYKQQVRLWNGEWYKMMTINGASKTQLNDIEKHECYANFPPMNELMLADRTFSLEIVRVVWLSGADAGKNMGLEKKYFEGERSESDDQSSFEQSKLL